MKTILINLLCAVFVMLYFVGCQSKLAESPYGAKEQGWEEFIKNTYPDWEPPQTVPPESLSTAPSESNNDETPIIISDEIIVIEEPLDNPQIDTKATQEGIEAAEVNIGSEFQTYKVQKGDTLWKISRKFYGSGKEWRKIYEANPDILSNPDKVKAGMDIRIPASQ